MVQACPSTPPLHWVWLCSEMCGSETPGVCRLMLPGRASHCWRVCRSEGGLEGSLEAPTEPTGQAAGRRFKRHCTVACVAAARPHRGLPVHASTAPCKLALQQQQQLYPAKIGLPMLPQEVRAKQPSHPQAISSSRAAWTQQPLSMPPHRPARRRHAL